MPGDRLTNVLLTSLCVRVGFSVASLQRITSAAQDGIRLTKRLLNVVCNVLSVVSTYGTPVLVTLLNSCITR